MFITRHLQGPVVTLLSPSLASSQRAQEILHSLVGLEPLALSIPADDKLNESFRSSVPGLTRSWDSVASKCPASGAVIHFCSIDNKSGPLSLIGLTDSSANESSEESIQQFRDLFASHVTNRSMSITMKGSFGKPISPLSLLKSISSGGLPLTTLPTADSSVENSFQNGMATTGLKEIVIPFFDYATFKDGSTLQTRISEASLSRPVIGIYQWANSSTYIRPLPTAAGDQRLPPPSLIFQCSNLQTIMDRTDLDIKVAKIGYSGNKIGQLMMLHRDLEGLDIRYCSQETFSSAFAEAQESLLAASLEELQSTNALLAGGEQGKDDKRLGQADCWVEVRANLKRPSGFFHRKGGTPSKTRIANIPDLPYE